MSIFRKNKPLMPDPPANDSFSAVFNRRLHALADHLSVREQKMTTRQKKITITLFCIPMLALSLSTLYRALYVPPPSPATYLHLQPIARPMSRPVPDSFLRPHPATPAPATATSPLDSITH